MNKKNIIIFLVLLILVLIGGGYYFWKITNLQKLATGVSDPVNSTESVQDANPYEKTNPFSNIKVNPFE